MVSLSFFRLEQKKKQNAHINRRSASLILLWNFGDFPLGHVDHQYGNIGWIDAADPACLGDRFPDFDSL